MATKEIGTSAQPKPFQRQAAPRALLVLVASLLAAVSLGLAALANQPWLCVVPGLVTYSRSSGGETVYALSPLLTQAPDACGMLVHTDASGDENIEGFLVYNSGVWEFSVALPGGSEGAVIPYALYGNTMATDGSAMYPRDSGKGVTVLQAVDDGYTLRISLHAELDRLNLSGKYLCGFLAGIPGDALQPVGRPVAVTNSASCTLDAQWEPALSGTKSGFRCVVYCYSETDALLWYPCDTVIASPDAVVNTPVVASPAIPATAVAIVPTVTPTSAPISAMSTASALITTAPPVSTDAKGAAIEPASDVFTWYDSATRYWYHQLSETEKTVFAILYDGIMAFQDTIFIPVSCTDEQLSKVFYALYYDCPELFQLGLTYSVTESQDINIVFSVSPQYAFTKTQYQADLTALFAKLKTLAGILNFGQAEWERELAIFAYIKSICVYEDNYQYSSTACGPFLHGQAICTGYSRALEIALRYYGIRCMEASGRSTLEDNPAVDDRHSWIYAHIDGEWYQCDITWDDIYVAAGATLREFYPFFNLTDAQMFASHVLDTAPGNMSFPLCTSTAANYYVKLGSIIPAGSDVADAVFAALTAAHRNNETEIPLAFESKADYSTAVADIGSILRQWKDGGTVVSSFEYLYSNGGQVLELFNVKFRD